MTYSVFVPFLIILLGAKGSVDAFAPPSSSIRHSDYYDGLITNARALSTTSTTTSILFATEKDTTDNNNIDDDDEDDDGWGETKDDTTTTDTKASSLSELESLRASRLEPKSTPQQQQQQPEQERDLFIPIFALVSVIGFGGLYAYETFRLYLNGELYLPGSN